MAWLSTLAQLSVVAGLVLLVLWFPDGHLPSRRWRPVEWATAVGFSLSGATIATSPALEDFGDIPNPAHVQLPEPVLLTLGLLGAVLACAGAVGALGSMLARYRTAQQVERQQLKWFVWMLVAATTLLFVPGVGDYSWVVGPASLAAAAAIAIVRYDLYDIDVIIRRSLVYANLTVLLVATYVGVVQLLTVLMPAGASASLLATAAVAVAFAPMRDLLQRSVFRFLYGERRDPYRATSRLAEQLTSALGPTEVLRAVVETVADSLRSPFVAIEVGAAGDERTAVCCGRRREVSLRLPLTYQGQVVGQLAVAPRSGDERFTDGDLRLLSDLSRQAGVAAQAVTLTTALQRSRERLVTLREEKRRRLRRDLHDGLGPALTGVALLADAARGRLHTDPAAADLVLLDLRAETKAAIESIRRLVYDLRPPALDELGLVGAIREQAIRLGRGEATSGNAAGQLIVDVEAPELPPLPAAVEVAAYRIVAEALTNVARHAQAGRCTVRIDLTDALEVEIRDDGTGVCAGHRAGVGSTSMRERAAELGGSCTIEAPPGGGTRVHAILPRSLRE